MSILDNFKIIRRFRGKTQAEVMRDTGISKQNISAWENGRSNPGLKYMDVLSTYFRLPREIFYKKGLNLEYLENTFGDENHTPVQNRTDNNQKTMDPRETFYRDLIESNQDYSLIPKTILTDYKIVPEKVLNVITESKDQLNRELQAKHEIIIHGYENKIARLEEEKTMLLQQNEQLKRQIPGQHQ